MRGIGDVGRAIREERIQIPLHNFGIIIGIEVLILLEKAPYLISMKDMLENERERSMFIVKRENSIFRLQELILDKNMEDIIPIVYILNIHGIKRNTL